ncbi:MAG: hypothetical protein J5504_05755 [Butyrivibrio sp.]|nr:hypothetical protein [Butyrivibrio sp.]
MKRFYSRKAKIVLAIACIFFFICFCVSVVAFSILHRTSYRETGRVKDFDVDVYEDAGIAYAVLALSKHDSGFNSDLLNGMNCNYGIIEGKVDSDTDLNDNSIYLYRNFDGIAVPDKVGYKFFSKEYTVNSGTVFNHSDKFLRVVDEPNSIITDTGNHEEIYEVHGIGYDPLGKRAYVYANDSFIALDSFWYETDGVIHSGSDLGENDGSVEITRDADYAGNDGEAKNVDSSFSTIMADNKQGAKEDTEEGAEENDKLYIAGNEYDPISKTIEGYKLCLNTNGDMKGILSGDYVADLSPIHETLKEMDSFDSVGTMFTDLGDAPKIKTEVENPENKHYTVVCFPNEDKLSAKDHVNDYYAKADKIVAVTDAVNPFLLFLGIITFIMIWVCFVVFIKAVGHTRDSEEILDNPIANKPIDLVLVCTAVFEFTLLGISYYIARSVSHYMDLVALFVILVSMVTVGLIFCSSLAVNYKLHRLHRNYLVAKLFEKINGVPRYGFCILQKHSS